MGHQCQICHPHLLPVIHNGIRYCTPIIANVPASICAAKRILFRFIALSPPEHRPMPTSLTPGMLSCSVSLVAAGATIQSVAGLPTPLKSGPKTPIVLSGLLLTQGGESHVRHARWSRDPLL